jgi:O-antigen/teichoic acid export membrane protein
MASRLRNKPSAVPESNVKPTDSWRPFAQFREVIESEDLVGQLPQTILVPAPAILPVHRNGTANGTIVREPDWVPRDLRERIDVGSRPVAIPSRTPTPGVRDTARDVPTDPAGRPDAMAVAASESRAALKNATTLGSSLVFTTAIGFAVSLYYQARLGPAPAGRVAAAEGLAATTLVIMAFGLDNYARKEVALRPGHAKEFVPGAIITRFFATIPFLAIVMSVMALVGRSRQVIILLALFGAVRFLVQSNELLAACLHAVGSVRGLSRQNLVTKFAWGVAIIGFLHAGFGGYSIPMGWIVGEALKLAGLSRRTGRELHMWSAMGGQKVLPVLRRSVPFLSSSVLTALAMVLDVTMMQFLTNDDELGYYRFAQSLLLLVLILATVLPWVLLPMASKAAGRSPEDFADVMRRSLGSVMALAIPLCTLLALNADTVITTVAPKFAPAIPALRILAVTAVGTYLTLVCATFLQASGKTWVGVRIGMSIVALDAVLVLVFVPIGWRHWGAGGAGTTAALAILAAEFVGTSLYVRSLGRAAWDGASVRIIVAVLLATVPVILADRFMAAKGFSFLRCFADVVVYGLNLVLLRVVEPAKLRTYIKPWIAWRAPE